MSELPRIPPTTPSVPVRPVRAPERTNRDPQRRREQPKERRPEATDEPEEGEGADGGAEIPRDDADGKPPRSGGSVDLRV